MSTSLESPTQRTAVAESRAERVRPPGQTVTGDLGDSFAIDAAIERMQSGDVVARIWERDHTLWSPYPVDILNRLGWLDLSVTMPEQLPQIRAFVEAAVADGIEHVVVLGMGGASLVAEVFQDAFPDVPGAVRVSILDSTHPDEVRRVSEQSAPLCTLFVLSMKAWALETYALFNHFYQEMVLAHGEQVARSRFAVITDNSAWVRPFADTLELGTVFENDPYVGGRFAALTHVGLVPAALRGVDVDRLLSVARTAEARCRDAEISPEGNVGAWLGAVMAGSALAGRDKLTFLAPPRLRSWLGWVEQLIAESTGKNGVGIVPVLDYDRADVSELGDDRLFVVLRSTDDADDRLGEAQATLLAAGFPVIEITVNDPHDLAAQFVYWEFATAVASHLLGVHAFNQPDVEAAKEAAGRVLADFAESGEFEAGSELRAGRLSIQGSDAATARAAASRFIAAVRPGDYLAIQAYLPVGDRALARALEQLRDTLRTATGVAVTLGYGPRFLHSTGQLHKGDRGNGRFLQILSPASEDLPVLMSPTSPGSSYSFGELITAQALGDADALTARGRPVLRAQFLDPVDVAGIQQLAALLLGT